MSLSRRSAIFNRPVERAALIDEITHELAAIESVGTLEETLAAIREQRATDPAMTDTDDATE
ncbi:hypothetical protein [Halorubrum sp. SP9]|uniref:hypothetical protein n=1 Tax=Halorubrum sp. SP9 TaxID=1537267 RepID=UPI0010F7490E|nr:hypothetical protein [Halorubrum sp. SP9]TKX69215.1 hypothetical protein EXE45_08815 [Halorubrum sp. SP9]